MLTLEEIKQLAPKEVDEEIKKAKTELYKLRLQNAANQLKETHKLKFYRKYIARLGTLKAMMKREAPSKAKDKS